MITFDELDEINNFENYEEYFDHHSFICPKCSETLFTKIYYRDKSSDPYVEYYCPQNHAGNLDIKLFYIIFDPSYKEIEKEISKFDEELQEDIENYKKEKKNKEYEEIKKMPKIQNLKNNLEEEKKIRNFHKINVNETDSNSQEKLKKKSYPMNLLECDKIQITLTNNNISKDLKNNIDENKTEKNNINQLLTDKKINQKNKINNNSEQKYNINQNKCPHEKSRHIAYCSKCRENICAECLKGKHSGHSYISIKNIEIYDEEKVDKNKSKYKELYDFVNSSKYLIENIEDKMEKNILIKMINAFSDLNEESFELIRPMMKTNLKKPVEIKELINILINYDKYCFPSYLTGNTKYERYKILFETFKEYINTENPTEEQKIKINKIFNDKQFDYLLKDKDLYGMAELYDQDNEAENRFSDKFFDKCNYDFNNDSQLGDCEYDENYVDGSYEEEEER